MVIVGLPYSFQGQMRLDEITGGSPYEIASYSTRSSMRATGAAWSSLKWPALATSSGAVSAARLISTATPADLPPLGDGLRHGFDVAVG